MECPYCHKPLTFVTNSRTTKSNSQIWRRRRCSNCKAIFTTHEIIDLSHIIVVKRSGEAERFSRVKLYSGIYGATIGSKLPHREFVVDKITREIERQILFMRLKRISTADISDIVLNSLKKLSPSTFLRYLAYNKNPKTPNEILKEINKYISS